MVWYLFTSVRITADSLIHSTLQRVAPNVVHSVLAKIWERIESVRVLTKSFLHFFQRIVVALGEQHHTCATFVAEQDVRRYTQYSSVTLANDVHAANEACTVGHGDAWVRHSWMAGFGQTSHTEGWTSWGARVSPRWCTTDCSRLHSSWKLQARRVDVASSNRITSRRRFVVVWYSFASPIDSNAHA